MKTFIASSSIALTAALAFPASAQDYQADTAQAQPAAYDDTINVYGQVPTDLSGLPEGPEVEGFISARQGNELQVTATNGALNDILVAEGTEIRARGGFLGLGRTKLGSDALLNGIPVTVQTVQWEGGLVASRVSLKDDDLESARMIANATNQRFAMNETNIGKNAAATEALRGRMGDIDKYNVMGTTNVYFDTGKYNLSEQARAELCAASAQADAMDNALLLVVGYTDSTGNYEINQELSEKRAERVVNYLQQQCGWAPYRMLTPTGMAEADPAADNMTEQGKAQNRRVAVNVLVSKAVAGL